MQSDNQYKGFKADEAIGVGDLVKVGSARGYVAQADATDTAIGVAESAATAAGDHLNVKLFGLTFEGEVSAAIALGARVKHGANGELATAAASEVADGIALEAATADGDIIEFASVPVASAPTALAVYYASSHASNAALTDATMGAVHTTAILSANGTAALAIPGCAAANSGRLLTVKKTGTAGAVTITPASGTIAGGATHTALDAQNDVATFVSDGSGDWKLLPYVIA